jgi:hypothetical protein
VATTRCTSGWRGQKLDVHCVPALQGKLLTPDKEEDGHTRGHLFVFLSRLFPFHLFTSIVTRALTLGTTKGAAGATSRGGAIKNNSLSKHSSSHTTKETWDPLPLSKPCTSYYEHSGARQHEQQQHPLDVGTFFAQTSISPCVRIAHHLGLNAHIQIHLS